LVDSYFTSLRKGLFETAVADFPVSSDCLRTCFVQIFMYVPTPVSLRTVEHLHLELSVGIGIGNLDAHAVVSHEDAAVEYVLGLVL